MYADELLRPIGDGGEPRDRDRRGVGREHAVLAQDRTQIHEDLALDLFILGCGFENEIAVGKSVLIERRLDSRQCRLPGLRIDLPALDEAPHIGVDMGESRFDPVFGHVVEPYVEAGKGADLGNASTHLAGTDDTDFKNFSHGSSSKMGPHPNGAAVRRSIGGKFFIVLPVLPRHRRLLASSSCKAGRIVKRSPTIP